MDFGDGQGITLRSLRLLSLLTDDQIQYKAMGLKFFDMCVRSLPLRLSKDSIKPSFSSTDSQELGSLRHLRTQPKRA